MKKIKKTMLLVMLLCFVGFTTQSYKAIDTKKVQISLLLDTSGSMQGLIEQAKSQLWKMVNELTLTKYHGTSPQIELSLYEYGKSSLSERDAFIRQIVPLTTDLDKISEELFKLRTNGGEEYCGAVIHKATEQLKWTDKNALKIIFIAGNEPFTQGSYDYKKACKEAVLKNIVINTIFCGNNEEGIRTHWKDGADLAEGKYMNINHNQTIVHIDAPQDKALLELNKKLNETYIGYGSLGKKNTERQMEQDEKAKGVARGYAAQRVAVKSSSAYNNSTWDLVDAVEENENIIEELEDEELPEELQGKNKEEIETYVEEKREEREKLQKIIRELNTKRCKYIEAKRKETAENSTLDNAIISTIREQAQKNGLNF